MSDVTRPQQDPKPGRTPIAPLVIADINDRVAAGEAKYGTVLKSDNGRDPLVDAYQEALDLVMYLRQAIEERKESEHDMEERTELLRASNPSVPEPIYTPRALQEAAGERRETAREFLARRAQEAFARPGRFIPITGDPVQHELTPRIIAETDGHGNITKVHEETILEEAQRLVHGDRGEAYGHPIFDMTRTADMLTALLRDKLRVGVRLEAEDVGMAMVCVKMSRHRNKAKRDNLTDTAGYAETLSMIQQWREQHGAADPRDRY